MFAAKGLRSSWNRLGDISAAVDSLQNIKKQMKKAFETPHRGVTHTSPDTSSAAWRVANDIKKFAMHKVVPDRADNTSAKLVKDTRSWGEEKLISSSLATFNQKVRSLINGQVVEDEEDELPPVDLNLDTEHSQ